MAARVEAGEVRVRHGTVADRVEQPDEVVVLLAVYFFELDVFDRQLPEDLALKKYGVS
jgi:hypothetical protein